MSKVLDKYGQIKESDLVSTTDSVKGKIISRIQDEFNKCIDGISKGENGKKQEIDQKSREKLKDILTDFIENLEKD